MSLEAGSGSLRLDPAHHAQRTYDKPGLPMATMKIHQSRSTPVATSIWDLWHTKMLFIVFDEYLCSKD